MARVGHKLATVLGIDLNPYGAHDANRDEKVTRGESVFSLASADSFVEDEPSAWEWISSVTPSRRTAVHWLWQLFPFVHWISRYNLQWLAGDLVAGMCAMLDLKHALRRCAAYRLPLVPCIIFLRATVLSFIGMSYRLAELSVQPLLQDLPDIARCV